MLSLPFFCDEKWTPSFCLHDDEFFIVYLDLISYELVCFTLLVVFTNNDVEIIRSLYARLKIDSISRQSSLTKKQIHIIKQPISYRP